MPDEIHYFSDFAEAKTLLDGKKKRMDEVLNRPMIIRGHKIIPSKKNSGEMCLHLQFDMDNELCILFTGSTVLIDQCEKYTDKIPFRTKIVRIDKYFTFS